MVVGNATAKITEEHRREAAKLTAIWESNKPQMPRAEFGEKYNIGSPGAVYQFLKGITPISLKAAAGFAEGLGCTIEDFSPRLAAELKKYAAVAQYQPPAIVDFDNFQPIDLLNIEVSAGGGAIAEVVEVQGSLLFRNDILKEIGVNPKKAYVVKVRGDSMAPAFYNGSLIMIDTEASYPRNGDVYAFVHDHSILVKRFFMEKKLWIARSDNPNFRDIVLDGEIPFRILGKAVWVAQRM